MPWIQRLSHVINGLWRYEYWPFWVFYAPAFVYWAFLALKARSVTYFTTLNPGMHLSGAFDNSKYHDLAQLKPEFKPVTLRFDAGIAAEELQVGFRTAGLDYPVIAKPDIGERGRGVSKISNLGELRAYTQAFPEAAIIQEFVADKAELGILYYRLPDGSGSGITSVLAREFLSVTGDGESTLEALVLDHIRAYRRRDYLKNRFPQDWSRVLTAGEVMDLEPIGNHNRGTAFVDACDLIDDRLVDVFDRVCATLEGFYYGRFDLKVDSLESMYRGEGLHIFEINGANSEPGHIYDPKFSIFYAYRTLFKHMDLIYKIAAMNKRLGHKRFPLRQFFLAGWRHTFPKREDDKASPENKSNPQTGAAQA